MDSQIIQYIIIAVVVLAAAYSLFRMIQKKFSPKKFKGKSAGCDSDCGCS